MSRIVKAAVTLKAITGIDAAGKRYEPGDTLAVDEATALWLIEGGHAAAVAGADKAEERA